MNVRLESYPLHYIIYKTINLINGKIYIGKHQTNDLNDDYLGSGTRLARAIEKYGIENFKREILHVLGSKEEMDQKEREIVDEDFLLRDDVYNAKLGGGGGWDFVNAEGLNIGFQHINERGLNNNVGQCYTASKKHAELLKTDPDYYAKWKATHKAAMESIPGSFTGRTHTDETKEKM